MGAEPALWPRAHRVVRAARETPDIVTLALQPFDGNVPPFRPGQFDMLYAFGIGEAPISISGDPTTGNAVAHTIRDVGPVTRALCNATPGAIVGVRGPFGAAWPVESARGGDLVFVGGGVGMAPLRAAICWVLAHRSEFGRIAIVAGARTEADILFAAELAAWRRMATVEITVDRAGPRWTGHVGVVTKLLPNLELDAAGAHAFLCGPELMMRFAADTLLARGIPAGSIYVALERNMKCAVGVCGRCQLGPELLCKTGAIYAYPRVANLWTVSEL